MKQEPMRFELDEGISARDVFEQLRKNTRVKCAWLVESYHWASEGYWIEFEKPKLSGMDSIIDKFEF